MTTRKQVFQLLFKNKEVKQGDIVTSLGLEKSTVSRLFSALHKEQFIVLIRELAAGKQGGRKTNVWALNPDGYYGVGIQVQPASITFALVDFVGTIVTTSHVSIGDWNDLAVLYRELKKHTRHFISSCKKSIIGIGVALPGIIDSENGVIVSSAQYAQWNDIHLAEFLEDAVGLPVIIENNMRAAALAEQYLGLGQDTAHFFCIGVDAGVGLAVVADNKLYRGANGCANDLHIAVNPAGPQCYCGRKGCIEAIVGNHSLIQRINDPSIQTVDDIYAAVVNNNAVVKKMLWEAGAYLGQIIAHLVGLFDPEKIIVNGSVLKMGTEYLDVIRLAYKQHMYDMHGTHPPIHESVLGDRAIITGAGMLGLSPVLF